MDSDFLLLNADSIFSVDFNRFVDFHKKHGGLVTLFTHPNSHPYDSGLIVADENNMVEKWLAKEDNRPKYYHNRVNAGLHVINPSVLEQCGIIGDNVGAMTDNGKNYKVDLDRQLLKPLAGTGKMFCYNSPEYVKDKYVGFLRNIDNFELIDDVANAIKKINTLGYLAIVVTNQPVIARGEVSFKELEDIHSKMETLLGKEGAYLDAIYFCPHYPHKGYVGERSELKFDCDCRKPKPGMLLKAAKDFNIDLSRSWMVGDSKNDIIAGLNAGCRTALIGSEPYGQTVTVSSLKDFVDQHLI